MQKERGQAGMRVTCGCKTHEVVEEICSQGSKVVVGNAIPICHDHVHRKLQYGQSSESKKEREVEAS